MDDSEDRIIALLVQQPGLSDRQITDLLYGPAAPQQPVNWACRRLEAQGKLIREKIGAKPIGNYIRDAASSESVPPVRRMATPKSSWPEWGLPSEEDVLQLARITMPYVRFLHPDIVRAVVEDNEVQRETWEERLRARNIDPSLYLWDRSACAFPGVRRHAGSAEVASFHGRSSALLETTQALKLDDNHYPKTIWSFVFRGKTFQNQGPLGYALAHLADHKEYKNRGQEEFEWPKEVDGSNLPVSFGLFTSVANSAFLPVGLMRPTDFSFELRSILQRRAQALYGDFCSLLPPPAKIRAAKSDLWSLDAFEWTEPVGTLEHVPLFLAFRKQEIERLLNT